MTRTARVTMATLAVGSLAVPLAAQDADEPPTFDVAGIVVEAGSGRPVADALVEVESPLRRVASGPDGRFVLRDVNAGPLRVRVTMLGYVELQQPVQVAEGDALEVALIPRPILLEGLEVTADRLESRRKAVATTSRTADRRDLLTSAAPDAEVLLRDRLGAILVPCPGGAGWSECFFSRGGVRRLRVWVDEMPMPSASGVLASYLPHELERVEFYPSLGQVRLFTPGYLERLARSGRSLQPICIAC